MYVILDASGRIVGSSDSALVGATEVATPDGWDAEHQNDWRVDGNLLVYDQKPVVEIIPEINTTDDLIAVTIDHEYRLILMEMGVTQ